MFCLFFLTVYPLLSVPDSNLEETSLGRIAKCCEWVTGKNLQIAIIKIYFKNKKLSRLRRDSSSKIDVCYSGSLISLSCLL